MFEACFPFGPCVTSNETFWPSLSVLKPLMLIAEKWANRSSPPSSGVMKPYPLESLNHLTVPVAIHPFLVLMTQPLRAPPAVLSKPHFALEICLKTNAQPIFRLLWTRSQEIRFAYHRYIK